MKPVFMTYTKKDLINLAVCMVLSVLIIPTFITTEYWYTSILIPWLCLALATIGQQIVMGYTGQLALGAAVLWLQALLLCLILFCEYLI